MADLTGIRSAIATSMGNATGIRESTHDELSGVGMLPSVKVTHISRIEIHEARGGRGGGFESRILRVQGKLLVALSADVGRAQVDAETYVERLFAEARTGIKLGFPTVVEDSWLDRADIGPQLYAKQHLYGADLEWIVKISESVTRTS